MNLSELIHLKEREEDGGEINEMCIDGGRKFWQTSVQQIRRGYFQVSQRSW